MEDLYKERLSYLYEQYSMMFDELTTVLYNDNGDVSGVSYDLNGIMKMRDDLEDLKNICDNILR